MNIKVKFLGGGEFAKPIEDMLRRRFTLVQEKPDIQVVANYGRILKKDEIEAPRYGTLNVHPSLLPNYRGATPLQATLKNGDATTGVCVIKMVEKVDAGPILGCEEIAIAPNETLETLTRKTAHLAAKMLPYLMLSYISGSLNLTKQDESKATYTKKLAKDDGKLDLSKPAVELERHIRACHPWPGSFVELENGKRLLIHKAHVDGNRLIPDIVQLEGRKQINWEEFKRGYRGDATLFA